MNKRKIPLKLIGLFVGGAILLFLTFGIFFKMIVNHQFVEAYNEGEYLTKNEEMLKFINTPESYLPYYNMGNAAFENTDYNSAIAYYTKALSLFPVGEKECDIRINLALSMCNSIDFQHLESQERVDTALIILYKARDILLENGWANDDPELARDADAQQLKEDIDEMIKKLENPQDGDNSQEDQEQDENNDEQDESDSQSPAGSEREKKQKEELDENKKNAMEDRQRQQGNMDRWGNQGGDDDGEGAGGQYKPW